MVLMETIYVISQVADMVWVGQLGPAAIAGVGIANIVLMVVLSMDMGMVVGVRAMVTRYVGAGDYQEANHVAGQGFILSIIWGMLITVIGLLLTGPVINLFGIEAEVFIEGMAYLRVMFAGWVAMEILIMGLYVIQSSGDARTPLLIETLIRTIHVALCPFLVLGLWVFPRLGVTGAALANVISQCLGAGCIFWLIHSGNTRLHPTLRDFRADINIIWRILKVGIPALVMNLQRSLGNFMLTWLIAPFGTLAIAAHSIAARVELFLSLPGMGFGTGAGVLVGQNLGAGQPERAEKNGWSALGFLEGFMAVCSVAILFWAANIMGIFTKDSELVALGGDFLKIATASYLLISFISVLQSCIASAGDTVPTMVVSIVMIWVIQLPLAYLLPEYTSLGVYGLRWAIVAGIFAGAIAYAIYFRIGRWKTKRI
jgi:putative MATE family efflux protein